MSTQADKLRAEGIPLELGGEKVRVRFTNRGKAEVEKRFGSTLAFEQAMNKASAENVAGPLFTVCLDGLAAGLVWTTVPGSPARSMWTEERIDAAMDVDRMGEYLGALFDAWAQAWPDQPKGQENGQGNAEGTPVSTSPGGATSDLPPSISTSHPMSSGT